MRIITKRHAMTVEFQNPRKEDFVLLEDELMLWDCSENATCSMVFERLDVNTAFSLRNILLGPSLVHLFDKSIIYSVQFNQILSDALHVFFQKEPTDLYLAFLEKSNRQFPANMRFICPSEALLGLWVEGAVYAITHNRLGKNTCFAFNAGVLSSEQRLQLETVLRAANNNNSTVQTADGPTKSRPRSGFFDFMEMIQNPPALQLGQAAEQTAVVDNTPIVRPEGTLRTRRMQPPLRVNTHQQVAVAPHGSGVRHRSELSNPMRREQPLRYQGLFLGCQTMDRKPLNAIIETREECLDDEKESNTL